MGGANEELLMMVLVIRIRYYKVEGSMSGHFHSIVEVAGLLPATSSFIPTFPGTRTGWIG